MKGLLDPVELDLPHVRVIVQGMVKVARSDGAHERELVLIRGFYESCRDDAKGLADYADLSSMPFDADVAREVLVSEPLKLTFLVSCWLVAYADGQVSRGESAVLDELAQGIGADAAMLAEARELVKDVLLQQVARSDNLEALKGIAKGL
jgi:hypothetical protein